MDTLTNLWLPILLTGIALHFASTIAWMISPHHKKDWIKLDDEDEFVAQINRMNIAPGQYMFPCFADPEESKSEEFKKKWDEGPWGTLSVWGTKANMGLNIAQTVTFFLVTSYLIGYISNFALGNGAKFTDVFRFVTTVGVLTYCAAGIPNAIWFKKRHMMDILDGIAYALIAGLIFASLWPNA